MSDIVERLRQGAPMVHPATGGFPIASLPAWISEVMFQAADEIERLRAREVEAKPAGWEDALVEAIDFLDEEQRRRRDGGFAGDDEYVNEPERIANKLHHLINESQRLAAAPPPADALRVKPLKWRDHSFKESILWCASSPFDEYSITHEDGEWPWVVRPFRTQQSNYQTLEEAKAAVEADYERRITDAVERGEHMEAAGRTTSEHVSATATRKDAGAAASASDWTVDDARAAERIMSYLGISTGAEGSLEPGISRQRDQVARIIAERRDFQPAPPDGWNEALRLLGLMAAEADNWLDTIPDGYRPLCTEPGNQTAHPGSETAFCLGDLRSARRVLRAIARSDGWATVGPDLLAALELHAAYEAIPADRGGSRGPKGRARQAWIAARDAAIAKAEALARPAPEGDAKPTAIDEIAAERRRQIEVEGWTPEHDDQHTDRSLAKAAACYAIGEPEVRWREQRPLQPHAVTVTSRLWPWDPYWWKPKDRRRNLIRAGALIVAEIERLDRAAPKGKDAR